MSFDPYPGQEKHLRNVPIALTSVSVVIAIARLVTTHKHRGWFGVEDFFIVASVLCLIVFCAILVQASRYGFGKHIVDIQESGGSLTLALKYYYLSQILYKTNITLNKLAFLFLYLRIFSVTLFRRVCLAMIYIISAAGIAFVILTIFQCTPIKKAWLKAAVEGNCVSLPWFRWTWTAFNLFTDLLIFMIPMPVISRLQMSLSKKIGLFVIFVIGFFICLTTGLRMKTIVRAAQAKEQTWESCPANLWSFIEVAVGVICACLISIRKILSVFWPDRLRKSRYNSTYKRYGSAKTSGARRDRPGLSSQESEDGDEQEYRMKSAGTFSKQNGITYDPEGKLLGRSKATVTGGSISNESQERIIQPGRAITVTKEVTVRRSK